MPGKRLPVLVLTLTALAAAALALTLRVPESKGGAFWSDEATYHSQAYSLAYDGDLRYDRGDLERVYSAGYAGGPSGVFLVRNPDNQGLYFAKAWVYGLAAAPFVRVMGDNGFFLLHALLLAAMLAAGYLYLRRGSSAGRAALWTMTYLLGSVATLYFFWLTPEWFNFSMIFLATFLWLYKEHEGDALEGAPAVGWLCGGWTDAAAAVLYAVAVFSKPPNIVLVAPFILWPLLRGRWARSVVMGMVCAGIIVGLFAVTDASLGSWNYQGGDRRTFQAHTSYPYMAPDHTFDSTGIPMTTSVEQLTGFWPGALNLSRDLAYIVVGRNGGLFPYMFPALVALALFAASRRDRRPGPRLLLAIFCVVEIIAIVIVVKGNWIGGGGTIGSRYFLNVYPAMFFLLPAAAGLLGAAVSWLVWGLFLAQIVLNPFVSSANPSFHTKGFPYSELPAELTILHNLPFNTNSRARLQEIDQPATFLAYFLDDGTWLREAGLGGFWVRGGQEAEIVLRAREPLETIRLQVRNRGEPNRIVVSHGAHRIERRLEPDQRIVLELPGSEPHDYFGTTLYRLSVWSEASTIPLFDTPGSGDTRTLGVFVRPTVEPARVFRGE
jgi:hypothetical protein